MSNPLGPSFRAVLSVIFVLFILICAYVQDAMAQEAGLDDEIMRYEANVKRMPDNAEAHRRLGIAYARKGMFDKAMDEFEEAMSIQYRKGYENGRKDTTKRIYGRYLALSIAVGLFIAAVIVSILSWSEMSDRFKSVRKNARIRAFVRNINAGLAPKLRDRAVEIAQRKEKLRDAISRETDSNLREAASSILPKLEDLSRQAALLLELQQNLTDYTKDIDPTKLEMVKRDCEEKLRRETDEETKQALQYQLEQVGKQWASYSRAQARIRTCEAVLSGIVARIDATSLALMSLPSVLIRKQEFFEKVSAELDDEISLTRDAAETVMKESA